MKSRAAIRASVIERFSAERMTDGYEAIYARVLDGAADGDPSKPEASSGSGDSVIPAERLSSRRADRLESLSGR